MVTALMRLQDKQILPFQLSPTIDIMNSIVDGMEQFSHDIWEDAAKESNVWRKDVDQTSSSAVIPELDLNVLVPCERDMARTYLMDKRNEPLDDSNDDNISSKNVCRLRDVITRDLLIEYAKIKDEEFDLATHPILLRNIWSPESLDYGNEDVQQQRKLTPQSILNDPQLSNLVLPNYFSDATKTGYDALVPDQNQITLSQFVRGILSGDTPNAKIGTQVIIETCPELRDEIIPQTLARELFGWSTWLEDWKAVLQNRSGWIIGGLIEKALLPMSAYPVFIASNKQQHQKSVSNIHPRTDLHNEPIGNIASQLNGVRHWTLVPARYSGLLRPTVSRHRGYFYSNLDPLTELPERLDRVPVVYKCTTRKGDAVWGKCDCSEFLLLFVIGLKHKAQGSCPNLLYLCNISTTMGVASD